jgi:pimeloyl-ACP methyl ester carboxylesterase
MAEMPVTSVTVDGISLAYSEAGQGYPLILINGIASPMDTWNPPVLDRLSAQYRTVIFDIRGSGFSTTSREQYSIRLFARDTLRLMDALSIPRAHILGFSMGSSIAQEMALAYPERVERLILVAGTCGGREAGKNDPKVWDRLLDKTGSVKDITDRMFPLLFPPDWMRTHDPFRYCPEVSEVTSPAEAARQAAAFTGWEGSFDRLKAIRSPTLTITGSDDAIIAPEDSAMMAHHIPGAQLVIIPGAGHGLMYQCPDRFCDAVLAFLSGNTKR